MDINEPIQPRRLKTLRIACSVFVNLFIQGSEHKFLIEKGLPGDTKIINARIWADYIELLLESEEFNDIPYGGAIPEFEAIVAKRVD